jgi:hypothetical protein
MARKYKSIEDLAEQLMDSGEVTTGMIDLEGTRQYDALLAHVDDSETQQPVPAGKTPWVFMIQLHVKFVSDDEVQQVATEYAALERRSLMRALHHGPTRERSQVVVEKPTKVAKKKVRKTAKKAVKKTTKKTKRAR